MLSIKFRTTIVLLLCLTISVSAAASENVEGRFSDQELAQYKDSLVNQTSVFQNGFSKEVRAGRLIVLEKVNQSISADQPLTQKNTDLTVLLNSVDALISSLERSKLESKSDSVTRKHDLELIIYKNLRVHTKLHRQIVREWLNFNEAPKEGTADLSGLLDQSRYLPYVQQQAAEFLNLSKGKHSSLESILSKNLPEDARTLIDAYNGSLEQENQAFKTAIENRINALPKPVHALRAKLFEEVTSDNLKLLRIGLLVHRSAYPRSRNFTRTHSKKYNERNAKLMRQLYEGVSESIVGETTNSELSKSRRATLEKIASQFPNQGRLSHRFGHTRQGAATLVREAKGQIPEAAVRRGRSWRPEGSKTSTAKGRRRK